MHYISIFLDYSATFQPSIPRTWQECFFKTLYKRLSRFIQVTQEYRGCCEHCGTGRTYSNDQSLIAFPWQLTWGVGLLGYRGQSIPIPKETQFRFIGCFHSFIKEFMVEYPKSKSTQPRYSTTRVTLYCSRTFKLISTNRKTRSDLKAIEEEVSAAPRGDVHAVPGYLFSGVVRLHVSNVYYTWTSTLKLCQKRDCNGEFSRQCREISRHHWISSLLREVLFLTLLPQMTKPTFKIENTVHFSLLSRYGGV